MKSRAGPNPSRSVDHGLPSWIGLALISTPWPIRNASRPGSTNEGSVVVNALTALGASLGTAPRWLGAWGSPLGAAAPFSLAGGYVTGVLKRPVMVSPWLWIAWTLPFPASSLNRV